MRPFAIHIVKKVLPYWTISVLVNEPTKGYGIFIENMLDAAG